METRSLTFLDSLYTPGQFMNPGPAPRPPTDRPRLNNISVTSPTTSIPSTNFAQMSLSSPATPQSQQFPGTSQLTLVNSKSSREGLGGVAVIKEGPARCKESGFLTGWKNRFLVLREFRLDFLKHETGKVTLTINLKDVTGVSRSEEFKMAFEITRVANPNAVNGIASRDLPTKTITCEVRNDDEIYEWIDKIYERCPGMGGVSNPTNFSHRVHVGFDPQTGAFVGLPTEWEKLLTASAITKEDYQKNPQAVIEVLEFYSEIQMRQGNPETYPSITPTPPLQTSRNMQLGHGTTGHSIAPPRPAPPAGLERLNSNQASSLLSDQSSTLVGTPNRSENSTPVQGQRNVSGPNMYDQHREAKRMKELADQEQRRKMEEEARRVREMQQQRQRDREREEEQNRKEQEAYNASIPKARIPLAQQEIGSGGFGGGSPGDSPSPNRYNPARAAPTAPGSDRTRQQTPGSLRQMTAQRQAPSAPNGNQGISNGGPLSAHAQRPADKPTLNGQSQSRSGPNQDQSRQATPNRYPAGGEGRSNSPQTRQPPNGANGQSQGQPPTRLPAPVQPVKPLNVANKQPTGQSTSKNNAVPDGVRQAEIALTTKKPAEARQKENRMSSMTEGEVMAKLKQVVSKDNPLESYLKQKKIGQGASGSVYVARVRENAPSPVAREIYRTHGPRGQVAIKQMDLRNQPRKELIVNEIIVMKDSKHPNIVNFLDSFLQEQNQELWVVMEFMEGGALTDVIENNPVITEDQIATISLEVSAAASQ
jgi:serine/threonine-protein kinase CLA4